MSYKSPLSEREHALEEEYFRRENQRLVEKMRVRRKAAEEGGDPAEFDLETIVVGTDFSAGAAHATDMAIDYARKFGSKLILVHAYEAPMAFATMEGGYTLPADFHEELRKAARDRVEAAASEVLETGVECQGVAVESPPALAIVNEAVERSADLVIMGTRGLTGLKRVALGSVADRVVHTSSCPVLTVPTP